MNIAVYTQQAILQLQHLYPEQEIRAMIRVLLQHYGHFSSAQIHAFPDTILDETISVTLNDALQQLSSGKPLQYVTGETQFFNLPFEVNEHVLIPRPETEELVQWAVEILNKKENITMLDACTGSGCIAVALAAQFPQAMVSACDISKEALVVAHRNAKKNHVSIRFFECDILHRIIDADSRYSFIISNPPYIRYSEQEAMHKNVLDFEPEQALFVDDDDPLLFYQALTVLAQQTLLPGGCILVEINEAFGKETVKLFEAAGFKNVSLRKDINGKDRMVKAEKIS